MYIYACFHDFEVQERQTQLLILNWWSKSHQTKIVVAKGPQDKASNHLKFEPRPNRFQNCDCTNNLSVFWAFMSSRRDYQHVIAIHISIWAAMSTHEISNIFLRFKKKKKVLAVDFHLVKMVYSFILYIKKKKKQKKNILLISIYLTGQKKGKKIIIYATWYL